MKLLHVIASMDPSSGGPCQVIRNAATELEKFGVVSEVVCLDDPGASFWGKDQFTIIALGPSSNAWRYNRILGPWLFKNLDKYSAVIVHGLWLYHSYAVNKAIYMLKKRAATGSNKCKLPKVYIMPHGMLDPYFQRAPERKLKAIRNIIYWVVIENKVVCEADGLLFTCEEELRLARTTFSPYKPKQEENVGLGIVEPPLYNSQMQESFKSKCNALNGQPYFLFLGRIHEKKGVDLLLKAYAKLVKTLSAVQPGQVEGKYSVWNSNVVSPELTPLPKLVIAGPGTETPFGLQLQKFVKDNKELSDMVLFPGMLAGDTKWGALYGCEAFVLPSHQENFGIAVVEALACSKPVLITKQINIWREIVANKGGVVVNDTLEDIEEMLSIWSRMSYDDVKLMGQQARIVFEKKFAIAPSVSSLLKAIKLT